MNKPAHSNELPVNLQSLKDRHQRILDAAGEGIYGLDCQGRTTFVNKAATDILGWCDKALIGKPLHDIHHHSHADGSPYPREQCPIYAALRDGEVHTVSNEVFWHKDGHCIPVEYTSTPIRENGKLVGAVVVFRDISERLQHQKEQERTFKEIRELKDQLQQERDYLRDELNISVSFGEIIGKSQNIKRTVAQISAVATTPASVLILGESGVGKEMIARAIHASSNRSEHPLVKVNCASIPAELFESEFFGHLKGAFTGAHRDRVGRMQLANGGTLFLDEVGEIPLDLQGKLLRALQEGEFERVGDERTQRVDVRIVSATNRCLLKEVRAGRFREDLFYRLSVFPIEVPALRERIEDIGPIAQHFLQQSCEQLGRPPLRLTQQQLRQLQDHAWPGNIRELKNVMERAVILSTGKHLRLDLALPDIMELKLANSTSSAHSPPMVQDALSEEEFLTDAEFRQLEKSNLERVLRAAGGKVSGAGGAAQLLGIKPSTLSYRLSNLGIDAKKTNQS
ncbi:sigma 54-interacting transcriptional regulator [Pseudomaricurvus alkylphenolicus]|jgi:PAS domain S-box-containing protein|uniref:sigma-54 interaction domain-containing protein n=1 Tax=Pseudomaricurvus alkylphenolicus TaxID=1306991 RepID=UPI001420442C|nr:sigma 54-interacting transcriptional regulator [Pseudomaricurvus alkylphenolicus]NIB39297.1 sigma 54-interacting transcriptional regulator [Pseudomaricurvus alkylphenolicus]